MFENSEIDISELPKVNSDNFIPLEKNYRAVIILRAIIVSTIITVAFVLFYLNRSSKIPEYIWSIIFIALVIFVLSIISIAYLGFKKKKYKLRQYDIVYKTGLLWKSETSIPFVRVQHSEVIQGPIERMFRLSKLKLYTAGGHSSDLSVPGLSLLKAEQLKNFITKRIQEEEE